MFAQPGQQTLVPKLQYVIRVDGWNWMVGSGLYTDDIDALVRKTLLADLVLVLVVMAVVAVWKPPWRAPGAAPNRW